MSKRSLVYGLQPVLESLELAPEAARKLYLSTSRRKGVDRLLSLAQEAELPVERLSPEDLNALCGGGSHQGVALEGRAFGYTELDQILSGLEGPGALLVLDQVQDPMNLGSLARTAAACGVAGLVICDRRAAAVTPAAVKASAGQIFRVPVAQVKNLARALEKVKEAGFWVVGAATRGGQEPWAVDMKGRVAVVVGSEGQGMRRLTVEACDHLVTLPLAEGVESLNVSVAGAMMMYEWRRQQV